MKLRQGNFEFPEADKELIATQRSITRSVNNDFIQVGAIYLKSSSKHPIDDDWANRLKGDVNLQDWIDDENYQFHNVGFNLQFGWMDVDIDSTNAKTGEPDPDYNRAILSALTFNNVDCRFQFGRRSVGFPTHVLLQLGEEEAKNFEALSKFEPREFRVAGSRHHVQLRSFPTELDSKNLERKAKQTVMPGSIYTSKTKEGEYDLSVWYSQGRPARGINEVATTTPRRVNFNEIVRSIAFGTVAYVLRDDWVEGSRQVTATRVSGWLARVVSDSQATNNHEVLASEVFCPVDADSVAESLIHFICDYMGDDEPHMRVRTYRDAREKLARNPDAKIPGWPSMEQMLGSEKVAALRSVLSPGSDVSELTKLAERYVYDETDNHYIDRTRHTKSAAFVHEGAELERRHRGDVVRIAGKPREAFKIFESSDMRKRVDHRDMYPDLEPGGIYRFDGTGNLIADDDEEEGTMVFNTWRGWAVSRPVVVDPVMLEQVRTRIDRLFGLITRDNAQQIDWAKQWIAWTIQNPGKKQQIAWVCVGGQGVGKSFLGNNVLKALFGRLWGSASPKVVDTNFSIEPFIDKMITFIDEAKFNGDTGVEEIKKLIRNVDVPGAEKFGSSRNYAIYSRLYFASNRFDMNVGQANVIDRALFYTRAYDKDYTGPGSEPMSELEFRAWANDLKPWFQEFSDLLESRAFKEHMMEFFATYPCDKMQVEDIKYSSSSEDAIVQSNMSWSRRVAKHIIEAGFIIDDFAIEYPFDKTAFSVRVKAACEEVGIRPIPALRVMAEFEEAGVVEEVRVDKRNMLRFRYMIGTLTEKFGEAIGAKMHPRFNFGPGNYGLNETSGTDRVEFIGKSGGVVKSALNSI